MKGYRETLRFARHTLHWKRWGESVYLALFLLLAFVIYLYRGLGDYLQVRMDVVNLWEAFIWFQSTRTSQIAFFLMSICVGYQSINESYRQCHILMRMSRCQWLFSRIIHVISMICVCNLFLLVGTWLACEFHITLGNEWSKSAILAAQYGTSKVGIIQVIAVNQAFLSSAPGMVGIYTFLLSSLMGIFTGLLVMVFALAKKAAIGVVTAGLLWYGNIIITSEGSLYPLRLVWPYYLTNLSVTTVGYGELQVLNCLMVAGCMCISLMWIVIWMGQKSEFVK